ncbi:hypothetical protein ACOQFV_24830 [Nocardiopsis changdeensis]|uniref:Uncharacterized protein n=1 Tax=Nocardiopsis changdeensis TaxID=2831969 RepID=A0ABX8BTY5_9ACTN|nr:MULTISPECIES: hypothetical protein [Nocardiopsis]QUX24659.1 hypothetical protein KGD84_10545 [Nocardiopsis changdeensis]QYX35047.1 hypothetical protein K1J57_19995 [Nocardiopsis sp. MT53]
MTEFVLQPTQEGELRRRVLFWLPAPLLAVGLVALFVGGSFSAAGWTILLATSVGVGTLLMSLIVQLTPLPEGLAPPVSARRALHRFRQFTGLRIALALSTTAIGAAAALVGGGLYPLLAALALALPQMLLAMPTFFTITRARRAMEAWGTTAYLWHALSRPAKVTWPIATPAYRAWRSRRAERSRESMRQKLAERAWRKAVREETENAEEPEVRAANERTDLLRPVVPPTAPSAAGADEPTEVVPHLGADTAGDAPRDTAGDGEEPTAALPHLTEVEPTAVLPHLGGDSAAEDGEPGAGTEDEAEEKRGASGPRATVNRAARQFIERGSGALGLAVRKTRRGHSATRPHPHKP